MSEYPMVDAIPYPLNHVHTPVDLQHPVETFEQIRTLLEQSTALARVLKVAAELDAESGELETQLPPSLDVLAGYCSTTLALFVRWQEAWQAQQAEAKTRRHAWVHRPLPQDADAAWAELQTLLEQYDTPERPLLTSLVRLVRASVPESGIPRDATPDSPVEEGA